MTAGDLGGAPRVVTNDAGTTIGTRITTWLREAAGAPERPETLTLAAGYVSFRGLMTLGDALGELTAAGVPVRLLLGVAPTGTAQITFESSGATGEIGALLAQENAALGAELDGIEVAPATRARLARGMV